MKIDPLEYHSKFERSKALGLIVLAGIAAFVMWTTGCSTKNYVRSQTAPLIQQTNELDARRRRTTATSRTPTSARRQGSRRRSRRRSRRTNMRWRRARRRMRRTSLRWMR